MKKIIFTIVAVVLIACSEDSTKPTKELSEQEITAKVFELVNYDNTLFLDTNLSKIALEHSTIMGEKGVGIFDTLMIEKKIKEHFIFSNIIIVSGVVLKVNDDNDIDLSDVHSYHYKSDYPRELLDKIGVGVYKKNRIYATYVIIDSD